MEYSGIDMDGVETAWLIAGPEPIAVMFANKRQMEYFARLMLDMPEKAQRDWFRKVLTASDIDIVQEFWK